MFGTYCAEKLYRHGTGIGLRVLVRDAGSFVLLGLVQNLPQLGGASYGFRHPGRADSA